jgi:hypothetical protein
LYHLTVMGEPSDRQPWGWQLDGHHLIINYFILRDQVVMTPTFADPNRFTPSPAKCRHDRPAGRAEQRARADAVAPARSTEARHHSARKTANNAQAQAFRDNLQIAYAGIRARDLDAAQQKRLLELVGEYVGNMPPGHAKIRWKTYASTSTTRIRVGWCTGAEAVFYYRIHSPVILIEFDHQTPVALQGPRVPGRQHIHTVVRTPNGNDYGKDSFGSTTMPTRTIRLMAISAVRWQSIVSYGLRWHDFDHQEWRLWHIPLCVGHLDPSAVP